MTLIALAAMLTAEVIISCYWLLAKIATNAFAFAASHLVTPIALLKGSGTSWALANDCSCHCLLSAKDRILQPLPFGFTLLAGLSLMPRILAKAAVFSQTALVAAAKDTRRKWLFEESYVVTLVAGPRHHFACLDLGTDHTVVQALVGLGGKDLGQLEHAIGSNTIGMDDALEVGTILSVQLFSHEATEAASATLMSNKSAALIHGFGWIFAEAAPALDLFETGIITTN